MVYRLPKDLLKALDAFEGVPEHYRRTTLWVEPLGRLARQAALSYVAQPQWIVDAGRPDAAYLERLVRGATLHGLPPDYLLWLGALARGETADGYVGAR